MNTKLTLRLDDALIRGAKAHAGKSGRSVSRLVADFFALVASDDAAHSVEVTARVQSLRGALSGSGLEIADYRRHLEEKHR